MTGVKRFNMLGGKCADSTAIVDPATGETFQDNAATMKSLFISQMLLQLPYMCCLGISAVASVAGDAQHSNEKTGLFQKLID